MKNENKIYIADIEEMIRRIDKQIKNRKINFEKNIDDYDLLVLRMQVIGESIKKLPKELLDSIPEVNWKIFSNFRNISSHNYGAINKEIFARMLKKELPLLKENLDRLKK